MNNFCLLTVVAVVLSLMSSAPANAEVFELKTGHKLEGDVLKQQGDVLLVDIGVDVVKVPLSQIKSRRASQEATTASQSPEPRPSHDTARTPSGAEPPRVRTDTSCP